MNIIKYLDSLDCTKNEIQTFISLLNQPKGVGVIELSKLTNSPRATLYGHLDSLLQKGLITKSLSERGSIYFVEDSERIAVLYNEKIQKLKDSRNGLLKELKKQKIAPTQQPKFMLYDTVQSARKIFHDILRSREPEIYWFWPVKEMIKFIPEETFSWFMHERVKRSIKLHMLWPETKKISLSDHPFLAHKEDINPLREVRILPKEVDQFMGYGIYGNKVAFISTNREHYGFIIDSQELSMTLTVQFQYFWKISKKHQISK